jgi:NAD(P)-dependent dehydrogenase (short-subunit alcohol dehydrogenase family)
MIDAAAAEVDREFGRLDILVNNAGILIDREPPSECQIETIRKTFETNLFGAFSVTKAFLPLIRKAEAGRIVNMSSDLASLTRVSDPASTSANYLAYIASKVALNAMTVAFAKELWNTPIKVNAGSPGYTATAMNNYAGHKTTEQAAIVPVRLATLPKGGPTGGFFDDHGRVSW